MKYEMNYEFIKKQQQHKRGLIQMLPKIKYLTIKYLTQEKIPDLSRV